MIYEKDEYTNKYQASYYDSSKLYPAVNYNNLEARYSTNEQTITVPSSYHVGEFHSPVSFKDRDRTWVANQNPKAYTIEIAEGEKASQVAQQLYKTPKNDRMAQIKSQYNGKAYYKGVYGSYLDAASAQKALEALPQEVREAAQVKNWGEMQQNLE